MLYSSERADMRQFFFEAWEKARKHTLLTPLEAQVVEVIETHPEYHAMLEGRESVPFEGEQNPFLHLGLHLAIRDQLKLNRPVGIRQLFDKLCVSQGGALEAEHRLMACLSEVLWEAQQQGAAVDEQRYQVLLDLLGDKYG
jgi:hypothetical protein